MIYEVEGDILLSRAEIIAQEVAVGDLMVRGNARKLASRYPAMKKEFQLWCEQESPVLGQIWLWQDDRRFHGNTGVVNMITKSEPRKEGTRSGRSSQIALLHSLRALCLMVKSQKISSIALPKLGTASGGLDWYDTRNLIYSQLGDLLVPVVVYVGERAGELAYEPDS